jgi:hypothetical protein
MKGVNRNLALKKMEIYRMEALDNPLTCSECKMADAEFDVSMWFENQDPDEDSPLTERMCGPCVSTEILQRSATKHVTLEKSGDSVIRNQKV